MQEVILNTILFFNKFITGQRHELYNLTTN